MEAVIREINAFFDANGVRMLGALGILVFGYLAVKIVMMILGHAMKRSRADPVVRPYIKSAVKVLLYLLILISAAAQLGLSMTSVVTVLGALGLAFSLALQNSLGNVVNGVFLMLSKPFNKGDFVNIDGIDGIVQSIGLIYTKLETVDRLIQIPNSDVAKAKITDVSALPDRRADIAFRVDYGENIDRVRETVQGVIAENRFAGGEPEPVISVTGFGDSGLNMIARVWVKNEEYWDFLNTIYEELIKAFGREGILLPYNILDVRAAEGTGDEANPLA